MAAHSFAILLGNLQVQCVLTNLDACAFHLPCDRMGHAENVAWRHRCSGEKLGLLVIRRPILAYASIIGRAVTFLSQAESGSRWVDWPVIATCQTVGAAQHAAWSYVSWTPPAIDWHHIWQADDHPTVTSYEIEFKRGVGYVLKAGRTGQDRQWPVIITGQTVGAAQYAAEGFLSWRPVQRG